MSYTLCTVIYLIYIKCSFIMYFKSIRVGLIVYFDYFSPIPEFGDFNARKNSFDTGSL